MENIVDHVKHEPLNSDKGNGRKTYIYETLGLKHDPFAYFAAEQEVKIEPEYPPFFTYFVDPPYQPADEKTLLEHLQEPRPAFVYAPAGAGRTTVRLNLAHRIRSRNTSTFLISYVIGKGQTIPELTAPPWPALTENLAIDLFIQVVEKFVFEKEIAPYIEALKSYWHKYIPNFSRTVQLILKENNPQAITGVAAVLANRWDRPTIRYIPLTKDLSQFLKNVSAKPGDEIFQQTDSPDFAFQTGLDLIQKMGYQQIFLSVDVVSPETKPDPKINLLIQSLLALPKYATPIPIYPKFFLPQYMKEKIETSPDYALHPNPFSAIILWDNDQKLQEIIFNRFYTGNWTGAEVMGSLSNWVIQVAKKSPRRILQLLNGLVDAHSQRAPEEPDLTSEDIQRMECMTL